MEIRFRSILLAALLGLGFLTSTELAAQSEEDESGLIEPQIERIDFDEALIDSFDFELALYAGFLAVDNFDTNLVTGLKFFHPMMIARNNLLLT